MTRSIRSSSLLLCASILVIPVLMFGATAGRADDVAAPSAATATGDQAQVMYLGDIEVKGQQDIVKVLQAIKYALKQPFSTDKAHEDEEVCRISSDPGQRTRTYLTCATNKEFTHRRYQAQMKLFEDESHFSQSSMSPTQEATEMLQNITGRNPDHVMRMSVDASKLGALLQSIPDPAPAAATPAAPAAGTSTAPANSSSPAALW